MVIDAFYILHKIVLWHLFVAFDVCSRLDVSEYERTWRQDEKGTSITPIENLEKVGDCREMVANLPTGSASIVVCLPVRLGPRAENVHKLSVRRI